MLHRIIEVAATARFIAWEVVLLALGRLRTMNRGLLTVLGVCGISFLVLCVASILFPTQSNTWREESPTAEQLKYADELGLEIRQGVTKGELAEQIQQAKILRRDED